MSNPNNKTYLGDGVYAEHYGWAIALTTEDGIAVTNEIYLEREVLLALIAFAKLNRKEEGEK